MIGLILPASMVAQGPAGLGHEKSAKYCTVERLGKIVAALALFPCLLYAKAAGSWGLRDVAACLPGEGSPCTVCRRSRR